MKAFFKTVAAKIRVVFQDIVEKLRPRSLKGYAVFTFKKGTQTPVVQNPFARTRMFNLAKQNTFQIRSILTENLPINMPVDIARLSTRIDKAIFLDIKFFAMRNDAWETEYFFVVTIRDMVNNNTTVLTSRSVAILKSLAVRFKFRIDWEGKKFFVTTPVKLQSNNGAKLQYSFNLPEYTDPKQIIVSKKPLISSKAPQDFQVVRSITVD
jgi:hypothetical protein